MKIEVDGQTLHVSEIGDLGADAVTDFGAKVRRAFTDEQKYICIDLAGTDFVDSCGLGALIALHKSALGREGSLRLLNPTGPVLQMLQLTRLNDFFRIEKSYNNGADAKDQSASPAAPAP